MKTESYTTIIIEAEPGFVLTQASSEVELRDRIVATRIALGKYDSPENYKEITQAEADEIKRNQLSEAEAEAQMFDDEGNKK